MTNINFIATCKEDPVVAFSPALMTGRSSTMEKEREALIGRMAKTAIVITTEASFVNSPLNSWFWSRSRYGQSSMGSRLNIAANVGLCRSNMMK
mmetsp:Transcript_101667/g.180567  ORF Transcript_101667/g.180567 Transcript_101667/m.180567 type:complete len:94 (+) Transcript_101667:669-950(+)